MGWGMDRDWKGREAVKNGAYILIRKIKNPKVDRRTRHDWRYAEFLPPQRYYVTSYTDCKREYGYASISDGRWSIGIGHHNHHEYADFLAHLEPDESLEGTLRYAQVEDFVSMRSVILRLVRSGVLSGESVRVAVMAEQEDLQNE